VTPADTLRTAATRLREAATAATDGPWSWNRWHSSTCPTNCDDPACFLLLVGSLYGMVGSADVDRPEVFAVERSVQDGGEADAAYIALMHPGVGLALADWLDDAAKGQLATEEAAAHTWANSDDAEARDRWIAGMTDQKALAVARALLGEEQQ